MLPDESAEQIQSSAEAIEDEGEKPRKTARKRTVTKKTASAATVRRPRARKQVE
jgi:hypothetical protein